MYTEKQCDFMDIKFVYIHLFSVILCSEVPPPKHGADAYMMYHQR